MDPKTTGNTSESDQQDGSATHRCLAAKTAPEPSCVPENRPTTSDDHKDERSRGVSLDPMRSTDRYRLVIPANPVL